MTVLTSAVLLLVGLVGWLALTWVLMSTDGVARSVRLLVRYLLLSILVISVAAISALGVWQSLAELGPSWRAATGRGVEGTFTAERVQSIGRGGDQQWRGTFVSIDRSVVRQDVVLENPPQADPDRIGGARTRYRRTSRRLQS